jgi:hypothetical protein
VTEKVLTLARASRKTCIGNVSQAHEKHKNHQAAFARRATLNTIDKTGAFPVK